MGSDEVWVKAVEVQLERLNGGSCGMYDGCAGDGCPFILGVYLAKKGCVVAPLREDVVDSAG